MNTPAIQSALEYYQKTLDKQCQKYIRNPGAVFCIDAQVSQKEDKEKWSKCKELSQGK